MEYCFISDLHIGGEGEASICDFEPELINLLISLEKHPNPFELIIVGDAFGLWEMSSKNPLNKLDLIINEHQKLFAQFKKSGKKYPITLIPGNHDYELACYLEFVAKLAKYNIILVQKASITRPVGTKKIWIEHGSQYDHFNYSPDFGNPHANPIGYWISSRVISVTSKRAEKGKYKWLKDIMSVYPEDMIPHWFFSNYFYKEMGNWVKLIFFTFIILLAFTSITFFGRFLAFIGITQNIVPNSTWTNNIEILEIIGSGLDFLSLVTSLYIIAFIAVSIPVILIFMDIKETFKRYGLGKSNSLVKIKDQDYLDGAKLVFNQNPDVVAFIYGHTHVPSIKIFENRLIINTGTWLKKLQKVSSKIFFMPSIYYPSYSLNYIWIKAEDQQIIATIKVIPKKIAVSELTILERLLLPKFTKRKKKFETNQGSITI